MSDKQPIKFGVRPDGRMTFSIGVQLFTLDYQPETGDEFEFMSRMVTQALAKASNLPAESADATLQAELERLRRLAACGSVTNWLSLSDAQKREWFAVTLARDSEQVRHIRTLEALLEDAVHLLELVPLAERSAQAQSLIQAARQKLPGDVEDSGLSNQQ